MPAPAPKPAAPTPPPDLRVVAGQTTQLSDLLTQTAEAHRAQLQALLQEFRSAWQATARDGAIVSWTSWTAMLKPVEHYLGQAEMHSAATTRYLLLHLLECVLRPFRGQRASLWKHPILLALAVVALGVAGLRYHFWSAFGIAWIALAIWAGARVVNFLRIWRIARTGDTVQQQIESNDYLGEGVVRQIVDLERRRVVVPTLIYSLLARLPAKPNAEP